MADTTDTTLSRKRATIRVTTVLKKIMGCDAEGNMARDMYEVFSEELPTEQAKQDFKANIEALSKKLQDLGIAPESVGRPIEVALHKHDCALAHSTSTCSVFWC